MAYERIDVDFCVFRDAIFSDQFSESVKLLKLSQSPLYSKIKLVLSHEDEKQKEDIEVFLTRPQLFEVMNICEKTIPDSLHFN